MPSDPPAEAARRLRYQYDLSSPAALPELLAVCADRGIAVRRARLRGEGYYLRIPEPLIVLDHAAGPEVLAHELWHALVCELAEWDDEELVIYAYSRRGRTRQERDAARFAELLCLLDVGDDT